MSHKSALCQKEEAEARLLRGLRLSSALVPGHLTQVMKVGLQEPPKTYPTPCCGLRSLGQSKGHHGPAEP